MLLYTRVAPPKVPKKRSRAGCNYCKEKKKKCDEIRPNCSRCDERGEACVYEPVRPRQRRKREQTLSIDTTCDDLSQTDLAVTQWRQSPQELPKWEAEVADETSLSSLGIFPWTPTDTAVFSPMTTATFDDEDVEEIVRRHSFPTAVAPTSMHPRDPYPSPRLEFCAPFAEFSQRKNRRQLVDHFCNVLSHLIVFREENGNPFQQLVLPLSYGSPAVMDAIYALASAHLEFRGVANQERSDYFHGRAIQELARLIENGGGKNKNELLAAIMLLVYYEVLVQRERSNIVDGHLKGAMTIINNREASTDPTGVFLERAFKFYDVIAALSFGTAPLSTAPGRGSLSPLPPLDSNGATSPVGSVDTLLGMATTLWPIIHRLSNLGSLKDELDAAQAQGQLSKAAVLRTELETTGSAIQVALKHWQPAPPPESNSPSERARLQSILNNALAYRHSAFVYLYRTIYEHPRSHALVQHHAHLSLTHCIGTVTGDGPMSALLWPLFVAACEATDPDDRDLAQQTFTAIDRVQGMTNIQRAWCIVQEVWRRADEQEIEAIILQQEEMMKGRRGGDLWRRVSRDMGMAIVFG